MKNEDMTIPVAFAANEKYAPYISVTIESIIENSKSDVNYRFYVLYSNISDNMRLRLEDIKGKNYKTNCINVSKLCTSGMYESAYFSKEMYYRIMIPEIFQSYNKVIYLDCDIVVLGDLSELYTIDISNCLIAGVRNLMHDKMKSYIKFSLELDSDKYINSGVIIFNCDKCRRENFTSRSFEMLECRQDFRYPDQDLINMMAVNQIYYLDPRWNFTWHYRHLQESTNELLHLSEKDFEKFCQIEANPFLIHYTGEIKPWNNANKFLSDYFWKYAVNSNFFSLYIKRFIASSQSDNVNIKKLKELQDAIIQLTEKMELLEKKTSNNRFEIINDDMYNKMIDASGMGKVGLKTILAMLKGWFKFKIFHKNK